MDRVIRAVAGVLAFWRDFIVGDDWRVAAGVVIALVATAALAHCDVTAWWLMPVAALALLSVSVCEAAARGQGDEPTGHGR